MAPQVLAQPDGSSMTTVKTIYDLDLAVAEATIELSSDPV